MKRQLGSQRIRTSNRLRWLLVGILIVSAGALFAYAGRGLSSDDGHSSPVVAGPRTTTAPPSASTPTDAGLPAAAATAARRIVSVSPIVARASAGTTWVITAVAPLNGIVTDTPFKGAAVHVELARAIVFPAGIPTLRSLSEGESPPPLPELVVPSQAHGLKITAMTALLNLSHDEVFAIIPGG